MDLRGGKCDPDRSTSWPLVMGQNGPVHHFLVTYLDSIDEQLLEYLDNDDELKLDAVKRLRFYTSALLEGSISPDHVLEDWPDWYQRPRLRCHLRQRGAAGAGGRDGVARSDRGAGRREPHEADRAYLKALETWLGMYPEMHTAGE